MIARTCKFLEGKSIKELLTKENISSLFFYIGILSELVVSFSGFIIGGYHESYIIIFGMAMFCVSILFSMDLKKDFLLFLVCGIYGLLTYYFQNSAFILRIELAILAGRNQDAKKVIKLFFYGTAVTMLYYGILSGFGRHNLLFSEDVYRSDMERRYTFGFYNPNGYAFFLFRLVLMGFYTYIDKMKWYLVLLLSIISIAFMIPSHSKIGIGVLLISLLFMLVYKFRGRWIINKLMTIAMSAMLFAVSVLWFYIKYQDYIPENELTYKIWMLLDKITTGRSGDSYYALLRNRITLFGTGLGIESSEMGIVDSFLCQGVIFMLLFAIITVWLFVQMIKKDNMLGAIVITMTVCYGVAESFLQYFNKNIIWMLCIGVLFVKPLNTITGEKDNV